MSNIEEIANSALNELDLEGKATYISPDTIKIKLATKYYDDPKFMDGLLYIREDLINKLGLINRIKYRIVLDLEPYSSE